MNKYKKGDVLRYGTGCTALFLVTDISLNHGRLGSHRYYGKQYYGSSMGAYESDCKLATKTEIEAFKTDTELRRLENNPEFKNINTEQANQALRENNKNKMTKKNTERLEQIVDLVHMVSDFEDNFGWDMSTGETAAFVEAVYEYMTEFDSDKWVAEEAFERGFINTWGEDHTCDTPSIKELKRLEEVFFFAKHG